MVISVLLISPVVNILFRALRLCRCGIVSSFLRIVDSGREDLITWRTGANRLLLALDTDPVSQRVQQPETVPVY